jgi:hypothetical protein
MTYLYEYTILDDNIKVEYTFSSVSDSIKVIDMWVDDKPHSINWMGPEARAKLMDRLEADMEDRMCGTLDDMTTGVSEQDEYFEGGDYNGCETEVDLDRDMPGFEGTWVELEDMVDNHVGEPEFLGGR